MPTATSIRRRRHCRRRRAVRVVHHHRRGSESAAAVTLAVAGRLLMMMMMMMTTGRDSSRRRRRRAPHLERQTPLNLLRRPRPTSPAAAFTAPLTAAAYGHRDELEAHEPPQLHPGRAKTGG